MVIAVKHLRELASEKHATLLISLCILTVYGLSFYKRQASYTYWMQDIGEYVVEDVTAMSTRDAYWWLKMAKDMDEGKLGKGLIDPTKNYPDLATYPENPSLLAGFISFFKIFTNGNYYRAGLLLAPPLAGLFVFPLLLYCHILGFGASAILGGLIGSFSLSYYGRSAMGCVDTDLLNIFLPMSVSAFVVLINRNRTGRTNFLLALGAGTMMYLFNWWYQQPLFFAIYIFFLAIYISVIRLPRKQIICILIAFSLASGPIYVFQSLDSLKNFVSAFFFPRPTGQIVWPDMMPLTQEAQSLDFVTQVRVLYDFLPIVFAGFSGLLCLYILRWKQMVPITPLLLIGLWSLVGPTRFAMYLAPFIGVGLGVLIELVTRSTAEKFGFHPFVSLVFAVILMWAIFFTTINYSGYHYIPKPTVSAATTRAFLEIKRVVPKNAAMFSSWSYGYPLMEIGEFATYQDGSAHGGIRSTLIAKAMTSPHQEDMVALLSSLEEYGFEGLRSLILEKDLSGDQLVSIVFNHPADIKKDTVHILYTEEMIRVFAGLSSIGTWDFSRKTSNSMEYTNLHYFSEVNNIIICKEGRIDLNKGTIFDQTTIVPLKSALFIKDGYVISRFDYGPSKGVYLQILLKANNIPELQVLEEPLFKSNFNQQYILGNFDRRFFQEVYNRFPVARVLRVNKGANRTPSDG